MSKTNVNRSLQIGFLVVTLVWFFFNAFNFLKGGFNIFKDYFWIALTDTAGMFGLGFRTMAALVAVITVLFVIFRKDFSKAEMLMSVRWIILGETVYMISLFLVIPWFISFSTGGAIIPPGSFVDTFLPVLIESVIIPIFLVKLFLELNPNKSGNGAIKWGLITGTFYVFLFWFNNAGNWISVVLEEGIEYVTVYPDHVLSFGFTTIGLLALTFYSVYFTINSYRTDSLEDLDLGKVGGIVTVLGLYFLVVYVMWLIFGTDAKWSAWYAWFLGHNMDLWILSLPLIGLPLLFQKNIPKR